MSTEEQIAIIAAMPFVQGVVVTCERDVPDHSKMHYYAEVKMGPNGPRPCGSGATIAAALSGLRASLAEHFARRVAADSGNINAMKEAVRALTSPTPSPDPGEVG